MRVKVLAIGKIKESYVREALADYEKRIKPYARLEIVEGSEEDANCGDTAKVLGNEGAFFLRHLERDVFAIALDLEGKALTSPDLAALLEEKGNMEGKEIAFLIGGSLGLSQKVKNRCQYQLSFGKATFPHQLIRVFLLEQIYRCQKILKNEPYHK